MSPHPDHLIEAAQMRGHNTSVPVHFNKHPHYHQTLSPIQRPAIYQYAFSQLKRMFRIKNLHHHVIPVLPHCLKPASSHHMNQAEDHKILENTKQYRYLSTQSYRHSTLKEIPISPVVQAFHTHWRNMISTLFCNTYIISQNVSKL